MHVATAFSITVLILTLKTSDTSYDRWRVEVLIVEGQPDSCKIHEWDCESSPYMLSSKGKQSKANLQSDTAIKNYWNYRDFQK